MGEGRRYRVLGVLGKGGFGTVYRAELVGPSGFTRAVALKVLNPDVEGLTSIAERLRDEARMLGMIRHRAIVQVDGLVQLDDRWTVVMEYIEGVDLGRLVARGPTPVRPALEMIGEAAAALHVARTWKGPDGEPLGLLHRDVKPQNLLLTAAGETKVLDFGVARADFGGREAVTHGMWFGSPGYVAPERRQGDEGPAADVFALGVVLYELLVGCLLGQLPGRRAPYDARMEAVFSGLATLHPDVRGLLRELLAFGACDRPEAREVERRCRELVSTADGEFLRDWAEAVVPEILARPHSVEAPSHDFSGSVLVEHAERAGGETLFDVLEDPSGDWGNLGAPAPVVPAPAVSSASPLPVLDPPRVTTPEPPAAPPVVRPAPRSLDAPSRPRHGLGALPFVIVFSVFAAVAVLALIWGSYLLFLMLLAMPYYGYGY